jgi:hypothetical protein
MAHGKDAVSADPVTDPGKKCLEYFEGNCKAFLAPSLSKWFDQLKRKIIAEVPDGRFRQDAVTRISKLDPAKPPQPPQDEDAMSKDWAEVKAQSLELPKYAEALAQQLWATGCALDGAPYVVRRFIGRFDSFVTKGIEIHKLADVFLAANCFGSQGLSETDTLKLREIHAYGATRAL